MASIFKRSARAILVDDRSRLMLIKRTKLGQPPYWTTPGGGVGSSDASPAAALQRELTEELGVLAEGAEQVFLRSSPMEDGGVSVQHFFVCSLRELDWSSQPVMSTATLIVAAMTSITSTSQMTACRMLT